MDKETHINNVPQTITGYSIGIGITGGNLPECAKDVEQMTKALGDTSYRGVHYAADAIALSTVVDMVRDAPNASPANRRGFLHYSGHGTVVDNEFALWMGHGNIILWSQFVREVVTPMAAKFTNLTVLLDTCFSGRAAKKTLAATEFPFGKGAIITKSMNENPDLIPTVELVNDPEQSKLLNVAVITACGRREYADGAWYPMTEAGWASYSTLGMSLCTYCVCQQIYLASNMEYVARYNWDYRRLSDKARPISQVVNGSQSMVHGMRTHFGSPLYQAIPPRSDGPTMQQRIGKKHDGNLFDVDPNPNA